MPRVLRSALVLGLAASLVGLPSLPRAVLAPMEVREQRLPLAFAAGGEDEQWVSEELEGEQTIAGLTWEDVEDAPDEAEVRVRVDGEWSDWESLEVDTEHAPDPGSDEDLAARGGTAPIVVEGADAIQFRVSDADAPADITADLVDVEDPDGANRVTPLTDVAEASAGRPSIHPRSDWGGESCPGSGGASPRTTTTVRALFVHHTAGHTSYSQSQVPGIVRGICNYHVNSRGWDDIGYNALVDRYGGIWEGRAGGIDKGVIGAHTGGFNAVSTGVALIGDHHNGGAPTDAALESLAKYAAWKLDVHGVDPTDTTTVTSAGSSKHSSGKRVTLDTISGHRDASWTSCPGDSCYARLDLLRARVDELGGFRAYGGWPQSYVMPARGDGSWEPPTFTFRFEAAASWRLDVLDGAGKVVHTATGSGTSGSVTWNARTNGAVAPRGEYSARLRATRSSDGTAAREQLHAFRLGEALGEFDDVGTGNRFVDDIRWLAIEGITTGCNTARTRFCPDDEVSREQMAAFLTRALDLPPGTEGRFSDVPSSNRFSADVAALARAGVTTGCNSARTRFCPDQDVTRAQMAAFLVRALNLPAGTGRRFTDVPASSKFADDIDRLAAADITTGCSSDGSRFCPDSPVTRAQMAAFLKRGLTR